ncbi:cupin domain-containing protein [Caproiciproducens sp. NJN-50]|uniref:cupin domain-containing protein n=1 Tax=Caproiciproducens sp. NJN-50 TaxID=2507162 RepID=UPI000FFE18B0|nr:cupin domain-containing protein [Caproiciproducens sp. NJN-50]QAT48861.1 cupin domain-containing protein [Caproiciproducens sp. NJN-50]
MQNSLIKNIAQETVFRLTEQVEVLPGQVVSKTLSQNAALSVTLFAFDKGEEIGTHVSEGDALVTVLEGTGRFTINGAEHVLKAGESLLMPSRKPHAVFAQDAFKMLLLVVFPPLET